MRLDKILGKRNIKIVKDNKIEEEPVIQKREVIDPSITILFTNIYAKLIMKCYPFTDTYLQISKIMNTMAFRPEILTSLW
jgi:hypothetical protein